jgi:hypothetical protein
VSSLKAFAFTLTYTRRKVAADVERIRAHAAIVLELKGSRVIRHDNPNPTLSILAVVGPGSYKGVTFPDAVLLEIGLGRGVPYHAARVPRKLRKKCDTSTLAQRWPVCQLDVRHYYRLSPMIFQILQEVTDRRVSTWKCGVDNPFIIRSPRTWYTKRNGLALEQTFRAFPRGCRFSVSKRDWPMLADIYWAQLNAVVNGQRARFIDKLLSGYKAGSGLERGRYGRWLREELQTRCPRKGVRLVQPYVLVDLLHHLPHGNKNRHYQHLAQVIGDVTGWSGGPTPEQDLAGRTCPNPPRRLEDIRLRDISGLRSQDESKDHVVIELFPTEGQRKEEEHRPLQSA